MQVSFFISGDASPTLLRWMDLLKCNVDALQLGVAHSKPHWVKRKHLRLAIPLISSRSRPRRRERGTA